MSKFKWDKINRDKKNKTPIRPYTDEQWKQIKGTFKSATESQKELILKYNMYPSNMLDNISKSTASAIIEKYIRKNWRKKD